MQLSATGDREAFGILVQRLWWPAVRYCLKLSRDHEQAQDLAQEGFIRLYLLRHRYQPTTPVRRILFRILDNLAIDYSRRSRARSAATRKVADSFGGTVKSPADDYEVKQDLLTVYQALQGLNEQQRRLIVLREFHGLSYRELAAATGLSLDSVRVQLHRARRRLQEALRSQPDAMREETGCGVRMGGG